MKMSGKVKGIMDSDVISWKNEDSDDEEKRGLEGIDGKEESKEQTYAEAISIANNVRIVGKQMSFNSSMGHSASKMIQS